MNGWFARSERLLSQVEPCAESGWLAIFRSSMIDPPEQLIQTARDTAEIGRVFKDIDLEAVARAFEGMAQVNLGNLADGLSSVDEAMAMSTSGEVGNFMAISEVFCVTLSACELAGDLVRCEHWCQAAARFAERYNCPFLSAYCRTTYGSLQVASGRWQEAEVTLTDAIRMFDVGHRGLRVHAVLKLAELRVYQGKLEEAEVLLTGYEDSASGIVPLARLYLARGLTDQARAIVEQALPTLQPPKLDHAPLLSLLVEIALLQGDLETAQKAVNHLLQIAETTQSDVLFAQAELAAGQVRQQIGSGDAIGSFQSALARLRVQEGSLLAGRARFEMAQSLSETDPAGAITWARAAFATFERIGAKHEADRSADLIRRLGGSVRHGAQGRDGLTEREDEILALLAKGLTNRDIADRLVISPKTVEHHVSQILSKLGLHRRAEAAAYAMKTQRDNPLPPI